MDLLSLGFLLLILVASGFVAFLADRLGKKLGKKRLSLRVGRYSLRPKHVAALGTVVMGILVSALTIALVASASRDARTWLREGRQLLIQRDQLRGEKEDLQKERDHLAQDVKDQTELNRQFLSKNQALQGETDSLRKSLEAERQRLTRAQAQRGRLELQAARLQTETVRLERETSRLNAQIVSFGRNLATSRAELASSRKSLALNKEALLKSQSALKSYRAQIRQSERDLRVSQNNGQVAYQNWQDAVKKSTQTYQKLKEALAEVDAATARVAELTTQREKAERDLANAQQQYTTTQALLDRAQNDLVEVIAQVQSQQGFLNSAIKNARTERMTFGIREEISRFVVPGGADAATARAALTSLIRLARLEAADRGAKGGRISGQTFEVADVFDRQDPKTKATISSEELKDAVVSRAAGRVEDQVLVATSSFNAFAGEPVSLDISVLPNPLIYHQGEMLSEARIDGSLTEDAIFGQISDFVRSRVRERAVQDRMIPKAGTDAPFGMVPLSDMWNLVSQVKRVGRSVRVQAIAGEDTRAADPLRLEFRLK